MSPCPLPFRRVLERLRLLEADLVRDDSNDVIMVHEGHNGYYGSLRGRRYPLRHRPDSQFVPVVEIDKMLEHLEFSREAFWAQVDHEQEPTPLAIEVPPLLPKVAGFLKFQPVCDVCNRPIAEPSFAGVQRCPEHDIYNGPNLD